MWLPLHITMILFAQSAVIEGEGPELRRWVSNLSEAEKQHLRNGGIVVFRYGDEIKEAVLWHGRCYPREARPESIQALEALRNNAP